MDFFGFHPLYVVVLIALALIIFGPSRLPKMGAQVGRMMKEFQAAREGLTQQMRDAFEEEPDSDDGPTVAVEDEELDSELPMSPSTGPAVAVLDPPEGESTLVESDTGPDVAAETQAAVEAAMAAGEPETVTAAPETPAEPLAAEEPPVEGAATAEPETAVEPADLESQPGPDADTEASAPVEARSEDGAPADGGDTPFASIAVDHPDRPQPHSEEPSSD